MKSNSVKVRNIYHNKFLTKPIINLPSCRASINSRGKKLYSRFRFTILKSLCEVHEGTEQSYYYYSTFIQPLDFSGKRFKFTFTCIHILLHTQLKINMLVTKVKKYGDYLTKNTIIKYALSSL